jgi:gas vesicle protein
MMADEGLDSFSTEAWDKFFGFLADEIEGMTDEEITEELRQTGVDVSPALQKITRALKRLTEEETERINDGNRRRQDADSGED